MMKPEEDMELSPCAEPVQELITAALVREEALIAAMKDEVRRWLYEAIADLTPETDASASE